MSKDKIKKQCLDDMFTLGIGITKTEVVKDKVVVRYIDPISPEGKAAMYNAEHTDSAMQVATIPSKLSDRLLAFMWQYEYDLMRIRHAVTILPHQIGKKDTFRMPRKLKKAIKKRMGGKWTKRQARFNLDVYKTMPYYGGIFLKEKP